MEEIGGTSIYSVLILYRTICIFYIDTAICSISFSLRTKVPTSIISFLKIKKPRFIDLKICQSKKQNKKNQDLA